MEDDEQTYELLEDIEIGDLEALPVDVLGLRKEDYDDIETIMSRLVQSAIVKPDQYLIGACIAYEYWRAHGGAEKHKHESKLIH